MKKIIKNLLIIFISIIAIFQIAANVNKTEAKTIGDSAYLQRAEKGFYSVQKWIGSTWSYIIYSITNYVDDDGVTRVAYCVNPELNGIGYIDGEFEGYDVQLKELLSDQRLWRIYTNGYPYKSPSDLGVENEQDAYLATKQAAYCIIKGISLDDVKSTYRAGQAPVDGQILEEIQRRGQKVVDAIYNLVDIGYNGSETMQTNDILQIEQIGEISLDSDNKDYYSINYKVNSTVECSEYVIKDINSFPEGSFATNIKGEKQEKFKQDELFKIMIPKDSIKDDFIGTVKITGKCKNYPIFYAECTNGDYQNYILCCDTYSDNVEATIQTSLETNKSKLQIQKKDKDTNLPIKGVKFSIKYQDGEDLGTYETDADGMIYLNKLKPGNIQIKEIQTDEKYILNPEVVNVKLGYNELKTVKIDNELKKGSIKIIKVDGNDNKIRIPNVKFEIYDENGELISTLITNENGEAVLDSLPICTKYTIKEVETNEEYELSDESITIKLEENEIKTLTFKNNKKEIEQTLPRTGEQDLKSYLLFIIFGTGKILIKKYFNA